MMITAKIPKSNGIDIKQFTKKGGHKKIPPDAGSLPFVISEVQIRKAILY
jgi:hypothetical protein